MRIAMIGSRGIGSGYGGIEKVLDELCPRLAARGYRVDVFSRTDVPSSGIQNISIVRVPAIPGKHTETFVRSALGTTMALFRGYDMLHFHALGPGFFAIFCRTVHQPCVVTVHGLDWKRAKWGPLARGMLKLAELAAVAGADRLTVVSGSLDRYFRERFAVAPATVPNGISPAAHQALGPKARSLGLSQNGFILFAGRLVPEKSAHNLIEAHSALERPPPLVIAGAGEPKYVDTLQRMSRSDQVIFIGQVAGAELAGLFSNARLFVLPSHIEGMSNALLEAVAYGRAILASDIAENRIVLRDAGRTFRVGDVADLRDQLAAILGDDSEVARLEESARVLIRSLPDWNRVADMYDELYRSIARNRTEGRTA